MKKEKIIGLPKKVFIFIAGGLVLLATILLFIFLPQGNILNKEEAKTKTEKYINENLMPSGSKVVINEIEDFKGNLYKMKIDLGDGQIIDSYVSKDGKTFFPQSMEIIPTPEKVNNEQGNNEQKRNVTEVTNKNSKPVVELFIMSYCPYGTQMQKGILPAIQALDKSIDFKLKFVNYAMHGEKELKENLVQYCIQKEQPKKLSSYLSCFLESEDSASCLTKNDLKIDSCVKSTDKEFKVTENFNSKTGWQGSYPPFDVDKKDNEKYDVQGSPTLVINGEEISSSRDPQSILETICSAFENKPEACSEELSTSSPTPGFGSATTENGSAAQCN